MLRALCCMATVAGRGEYPRDCETNLRNAWLNGVSLSLTALESQGRGDGSTAARVRYDLHGIHFSQRQPLASSVSAGASKAPRGSKFGSDAPSNTVLSLSHHLYWFYYTFNRTSLLHLAYCEILGSRMDVSFPHLNPAIRTAHPQNHGHQARASTFRK